MNCIDRLHDSVKEILPVCFLWDCVATEFSSLRSLGIFLRFVKDTMIVLIGPDDNKLE